MAVGSQYLGRTLENRVKMTKNVVMALEINKQKNQCGVWKKYFTV
jgi:hypothetical protein